MSASWALIQPRQCTGSKVFVLLPKYVYHIGIQFPVFILFSSHKVIRTRMPLDEIHKTNIYLERQPPSHAAHFIIAAPTGVWTPWIFPSHLFKSPLNPENPSTPPESRKFWQVYSLFSQNAKNGKKKAPLPPESWKSLNLLWLLKPKIINPLHLEG